MGTTAVDNISSGVTEEPAMRQFVAVVSSPSGAPLRSSSLASRPLAVTTRVFFDPHSVIHGTDSLRIPHHLLGVVQCKNLKELTTALYF
jgi:hypothetical protein